jgi:RimJ/RimL family protein N-acetyltransferase
MQQEGINRASYLRNGELIDQIMLGITKQEWLCQQ